MTIKKTKIGFIGFGNMAQAIAEGFLYKNVVKPNQLYACARNNEKLSNNTNRLGINACLDIKSVIDNSNIIIIAIKPNQVFDVLSPLKELFVDKIIVSVVANYPFAKYNEWLLEKTHHISILPNTPVAVGEGVIIFEDLHSLNEAEFALIYELFSPIALIKSLDYKLMSIAGTIAGCGPAFTAMYIEALADAGLKYGLPRDLAYQLASQMIIGTGQLQLKTSLHPGILKDKVCSPGGSTIVGVTTLEKEHFKGSVIKAIDAIENR